jgi:cytochrome c
MRQMTRLRRLFCKDSKCLKCHSIDKTNDGPSYKETAKKYKDKPDAMAKLTKHVTEPSKVEIDGVKEDHGAVKTRDQAKIDNLVQWILSPAEDAWPAHGTSDNRAKA